MAGKLSDDLLAISSMLMLARERGEIIQLASDLNATIIKAMEIEKTAGTPASKRQALSATIKFTDEEIKGMSKTFKKEFIANGCVAHIIKRPSGKSGFFYEIRYRRNGYNISVSNKNLKTAKRMFAEATTKLDEPKKPKAITFGQMTDEWLAYKKGKVVDHTWEMYKRYASLYFSKALLSKDIKSIRTAELNKFMQEFADRPRLYEDMRILLNSIFKYALLNAVISHNPVTLIPFKRAERKSRRSLTTAEIKEFLTTVRQAKYEKIRQTVYVLYFFGVRPCELDEEAHFENGFLICRNRKRKGGKIEYKKIPVPEQAREYIDFSLPLKLPGCAQWISKSIAALLPNELTAYNLRHTFATICQKYVRPDIVDIWMGDSSERLVGRFYAHFDDEFMKEQMSKVVFIT